jgi:peroxiredoxin
MSAVLSTMLPLGTIAPDFNLPNATSDKSYVTLSELAVDSKGVLIVFLANHCPFVKHIIKELADLVGEYKLKGLAAAGISSSYIDDFPDDSPKKMEELAKELNFSFPYLYDETQAIAQAYRAACTPDIYLFDSELRLVYRGQFDASRPGNGIPVTGENLRVALDAVVGNGDMPVNQIPAVGCHIKWKPNNEPEYFHAKAIKK